MEALRKKLNGSRGASILLALLFLLVCMMVGASVLMAAVSNIGRIKSNREEQQKYLTLSSALTLVCDELEQIEYVGKYRYGKVQVEMQVITGYDADGNPVWAWEYDHTEHYYWQEPGELWKAGEAVDWELKDILPLHNDLDVIFANNFTLPASQRNPIDVYHVSPRDTGEIQPRSPHAMTVKAEVDADAYGGLADEVEIEAELNAKGEIILTATFKEDKRYIMEAVLKPSGDPKDVILLIGNPEKQTEFGTQRETPVDVNREDAEVNETLNKLMWTLDRIVKKEAGG